MQANDPFLHSRKQEYYDSLALVPGRVEEAWAYTYPNLRAGLLSRKLERCNIESFVEIGCGYMGLVDHFPNAIEVDISHGMLMENTGKYRVQAAAEFLPFGSNSISCLVTDGTYQAVKGQREFMNEIGRVLKPGGTAFIGIVGKSPVPVKVYPITLKEEWAKWYSLGDGMMWLLSIWRKDE